MTRFTDTPVFSVTDILHEVPGVSLKQGNGPRDIGISIRGSNARNGFGIRNIVILDDGFPVTQPDGLSRSDLIDPHAYGGVDVWRGPSSALFGNYATGGAINFRTFPGGAIDGIEYGIDVGSFNYLSNYVIGGKKGENWEASVFTSDVRGDGYYGYSDFNTQTVNALLTYKPSFVGHVHFQVHQQRSRHPIAIPNVAQSVQAEPVSEGLRDCGDRGDRVRHNQLLSDR